MEFRFRHPDGNIQATQIREEIRLPDGSAGAQAGDYLLLLPGGPELLPARLFDRLFEPAAGSKKKAGRLAEKAPPPHRSGGRGKSRSGSGPRGLPGEIVAALQENPMTHAELKARFAKQKPATFHTAMWSLRKRNLVREKGEQYLPA